MVPGGPPRPPAAARLSGAVAASDRPQLLLTDETRGTLMGPTHVILKACLILWKKAGDLPYIVRARGIDGCHHVQKSFHRVGACKLDQMHPVPDLELVRRHGAIPRSIPT